MGGRAERLRVVVDDREGPSGLAEAVAALWTPTFVGRLPVGDVEIGPRVIVERKTVADFAASLSDGRLFRQAKAISRASPAPLLVVEGEDGFDAAHVPPAALRGVILTLLAGYRLPLLRTGSTAETAVCLAQLAKQERRRLAMWDRARRSGRTPTRAALEVLGTIPGVGDEKARRLIEGLGGLKHVVTATEDELRRVPGVGPETASEIRRALDGDERDREG